MTSITDNPNIFTGQLDPFSDQGSEGIIWCVHDRNKPGYDGLQVIESGDLLTVFSDAARKDVVWSGTVQLDYSAGREPMLFAPAVLVQTIRGAHVNGVPTQMEPEAWMDLFRQKRPCILVRPNRPELL